MRKEGYFGAAVLLAMQVVAGSSLDDYRWRSRLILVDFSGRAVNLELLEEAFRNNRDGILERELKFIDVSAVASGIGFAERLGEEATRRVRDRFGLVAGAGEAVFILIGKDGGEKSRQRGELDLAGWFALIDGMPMRRIEMRDREK